MANSLGLPELLLGAFVGSSRRWQLQRESQSSASACALGDRGFDPLGFAKNDTVRAWLVEAELYNVRPEVAALHALMAQLGGLARHAACHAGDGYRTKAWASSLWARLSVQLKRSRCAGPRGHDGSSRRTAGGVCWPGALVPGAFQGAGNCVILLLGGGWGERAFHICRKSMCFS